MRQAATAAELAAERLASDLLKGCKIALAYMEADSDDSQEQEDYAQIKAAIEKAEMKGGSHAHA